MADKTRAQLAEENEDLRARIAELEANPSAVTRPTPVLPSFGLSEGTRLDILEAQNKLTHDHKVAEMVIMEPFTGRRIRVTADSYDVEDPADEVTDTPTDEPADDTE